VHQSPAHHPTRAAVIVATLTRPPAPRCAMAALARRLEDLRPTSSHNHDAGLIREACDDLATTVPRFVSFSSLLRGPSPAHHPTRAAVIVTTLSRPPAPRCAVPAMPALACRPEDLRPTPSHNHDAGLAT
jgi:hypothetical protein